MYNYVVSCCDTDSITFNKPDGSPFDEIEVNKFQENLAKIYPPTIKWDLEFVNATIVVLKSKNYIIQDGDKITIKGSGLKSSKLEPALKEMYGKVVDCLLNNRAADVLSIYNEYIDEALNPKDITRWASKKTITKPVLNSATDPSARLNERSVYDALNGRHAQEGDKIYTYPAIKSINRQETALKNGKIRVKVDKEVGLKVIEDWDGEDHDSQKLLNRVYNSMKIFKNVIEFEQYVNYSLKKNWESLTEGLK